MGEGVFRSENARLVACAVVASAVLGCVACGLAACVRYTGRIGDDDGRTPHGDHRINATDLIGAKEESSVDGPNGITDSMGSADSSIRKSLWSGTADRGFGSGGLVTVAGPTAGHTDGAFGVDIDSSGRVVVMGMIAAGAREKDGFVMRLDPATGAPDDALGQRGFFTYHQIGWEMWLGGIHATRDGSFVVGATIDDALTDDPTIWKLRPDGTLDSGWGELGGYTRVPVRGEVGSSQTIVHPGTGDYLIAGSSWMGPRDSYVARFTPTGLRHPTFGVRGAVVRNDFAQHGAFGVAVDSRTSRIYLVGFAKDSGSEDMVIYAFRDDGALDLQFASTGYLTHDGAAGLDDGADSGHHVMVGPDSMVYVVGKSTNPNNDTDMTIWKLDVNGQWVADFGRGGILTIDGVEGRDDAGNGATFDPLGDLVICGQTDTQARGLDLAVWAVDSRLGRLKPDFGNAGLFQTGGPGDDVGRRVIGAADGARVYVVGVSGQKTGDPDIGVWAVH